MEYGWLFASSHSSISILELEATIWFFSCSPLSTINTLTFFSRYHFDIAIHMRRWYSFFMTLPCRLALFPPQTLSLYQSCNNNNNCRVKKRIEYFFCAPTNLFRCPSIFRNPLSKWQTISHLKWAWRLCLCVGWCLLKKRDGLETKAGKIHEA